MLIKSTNQPAVHLIVKHYHKRRCKKINKKNSSKKYKTKTNHKKKTKKGGGAIGYRLNLDNCGMGGMAEVSAYPTLCGDKLVSSNCKNNN